MSRIAAVLALTALVLGPLSAAAEVYRYTDNQGVSHYVDGYESVPSPYRPRAVPVAVPRAPVSGPASPGPAMPEAGGGTMIRYTPGNKIIVDAKINGSTSTRLLLDTGADRTLISPRVLVAAGASLTQGTLAGRLQGATGSADIQAVPINSLEVGDARVGRMLVVSHDIDQSGIDGLLGRDFLDQFKVTIDSAGGVVTIAPK